MLARDRTGRVITAIGLGLLVAIAAVIAGWKPLDPDHREVINPAQSGGCEGPPDPEHPMCDPWYVPAELGAPRGLAPLAGVTSAAGVVGFALSWFVLARRARRRRDAGSLPPARVQR